MAQPHTSGMLAEGAPWNLDLGVGWCFLKGESACCFWNILAGSHRRLPSQPAFPVSCSGALPQAHPAV